MTLPPPTSWTQSALLILKEMVNPQGFLPLSPSVCLLPFFLPLPSTSWPSKGLYVLSLFISVHLFSPLFVWQLPFFLEFYNFPDWGKKHHHDREHTRPKVISVHAVPELPFKEKHGEIWKKKNLTLKVIQLEETGTTHTYIHACTYTHTRTYNVRNDM